MKWLKRWWGGRRPRLGRIEVVTEERINERLAGAGGTPLWGAVLAVIELEVQEGVERCLDARLTNEQLRWGLGAVEGLLALKQGLLEREAAARKGKEETTNEHE